MATSQYKLEHRMMYVTTFPSASTPTMLMTAVPVYWTDGILPRGGGYMDQDVRSCCAKQVAVSLLHNGNTVRPDK